MRYSVNHFTRLTLGRRAVLRLMMLGAVGAMSLAGSTPAVAASQDDGSFWTTFTPSADTRLIFVSNSEGSDSNSGLTPATPVKSLARGYELMRDGFPDWMLLKRGDVWYESLPSWGKSGRDADKMMVLGAYGDASTRPQIRPAGGQTGMNAVGNNLVKNVAFVGFHLEPASRADDESATGIRWMRRSDGILFEDLYVAGFKDNFIFTGNETSPVQNIRINGCVVVDAWSTGSHSQGIYASRTSGLTVENSVIASNGFSRDRNIQPTIFNHNLYIQNGNEDVTVRFNIIADASSHGVQLRPGGVLEGNLFISNPIAALLGSGNNPEPGGVSIIAQNNVVMYGRGIDDSLPRSFGFDVSNIREGSISGNVFFKSEIGYNGYVMRFMDSRSHGITNLMVENNAMVDWHGMFVFQAPGDGQIYRDIVVRDNLFNRDLTANDGNGNFNKALVRLYDGHNSAISIRNNRYRYFGMHNRPFQIDELDLSVDQWASQVEPTGTYDPSSSPPAGIGLDQYLASNGRSGGWQEFVSLARQMSRQNTDPLISSTSVYDWVVTRVAD